MRKNNTSSYKIIRCVLNGRGESKKMTVYLVNASHVWRSSSKKLKQISVLYYQESVLKGLQTETIVILSMKTIQMTEPVVVV